MLQLSHLAAVLAVAGLSQAGAASSNTSSQIVTDVSKIQNYWGQLSPYSDNAEDYFGVQDVGLPDGCAVEQAHLLQRHAQRFSTSYFDDGVNDANFASKVANWTGAAKFTGPLAFLNTYKYLLNDEGYLTNVGATTEFAGGVWFWNKYGRLLFDAQPGQLAYDPNYPNGTARPKPVLRTTSQSRMWNTQINWALGFFGTSFQVDPDPTMANFTENYEVVVITEGGSENNTLAAYDSCINEWNYPVDEMGDLDLLTYIPKYLASATQRLQQYIPSGFDWTTNDTYAMQSICAYEVAYIGESQFCGFFTLEEWDGFENTLDTEYYYDYAWGNPTGRAQGIGYLQELLARLQNQYINVSNSSVNSTLTDNPETFPLGRNFYADFSHDDIIISVLTAMSFDYFKDPPNFDEVSILFCSLNHAVNSSIIVLTSRVVPPRCGPQVLPLASHAVRCSPGDRGGRLHLLQPGRQPLPQHRLLQECKRLQRGQRHVQVRPPATQQWHPADRHHPRRRLRRPHRRVMPSI